MKKIRWIFFGLIGLVLASVFVWSRYFSAPSSDPKTEIISFKDNTATVIVTTKLKNEGFIKSETALNLILLLHNRNGEFLSGGYRLSKSMNIFEIADALEQGPQLKWITFIPGLRKEQIAEKFKDKFDWDEKDIKGFLTFPEGQYYPDTYLIPIDETGEEVGKRMINRFNEVFAPLAPKFLEENIKTDTAIKIASLVQREASGTTDAPLIAGIIWNRLLKGMRLQLDASNQYVVGKSGNWWPAVTTGDLKIDSPYNLYLYKGLPPTPISNPTLWALEAVLYPEETDCMYYLHDRLRQIHCSVTYEEHLENIATYLR